MRHVIAIALAVLLAGATLFAENWPNWRGPTLNGVSAETGLPHAWTN